MVEVGAASEVGAGADMVLRFSTWRGRWEVGGGRESCRYVGLGAWAAVEEFGLFGGGWTLFRAGSGSGVGMERVKKMGERTGGEQEASSRAGAGEAMLKTEKQETSGRRARAKGGDRARPEPPGGNVARAGQRVSTRSGRLAQARTTGDRPVDSAMMSSQTRDDDQLSV